MLFENLKTFVAVKFLDGSHEIVPRSWLIKKSKKKVRSYWPATDMVAHLKTLVQEEIQYSTDWKLYTGTAIAHSGE